MRARKLNPRDVSCDPQGCEQDVYIVTHLCLSTDTGTGVGVLNEIDPQLVSQPGDETVKCFREEKTKKEVGKLASL